MNNHYLLIIIAAAATLGASCSQETTPNNTSTDGFLPSTLPAPSEGESCFEPQTPTLCEWVNSVDAVVVGNIDTASALESPVWVLDDNPRLADTCNGDWVKYGLSLKVNVTSVLSGETPKVINVRVGSEAVNWDVYPSGVNGKLEWGYEANIMPADAYLAAGTTVGLALTRVPNTDVWALMGDMPFTFADDGSAIYAKAGCLWPAPASRPADFWTLESSIKACPNSPNATKDGRIAQFTQRPDWSHAASCHYLPRSNPPPTPEGDMGNFDLGL